MSTNRLSSIQIMIEKMKNLPLHQKIALISVALYLVITFAIAINFILGN
jgi:hypothetical protein